MAKSHYNERVECRKHEGEIAAVCPRCYDAALTQQDRQVQQERAAAHEAWLWLVKNSAVVYLDPLAKFSAIDLIAVAKAAAARLAA